MFPMRLDGNNSSKTSFRIVITANPTTLRVQSFKGKNTENSFFLLTAATATQRHSDMNKKVSKCQSATTKIASG